MWECLRRQELGRPDGSERRHGQTSRQAPRVVQGTSREFGQAGHGLLHVSGLPWLAGTRWLPKLRDPGLSMCGMSGLLPALRVTRALLCA